MRTAPVVYSPMEVRASGFNIIYLAVLGVFYLCLAIAIDYAIANPWVRHLLCRRR